MNAGHDIVLGTATESDYHYSESGETRNRLLSQPGRTAAKVAAWASALVVEPMAEASVSSPVSMVQRAGRKATARPGPKPRWMRVKMSPSQADVIPPCRGLRSVARKSQQMSATT
ncbi:hypothetical protein DTI32_23395 [Escherichia coli]|nr:hypothetical protein [Escherichia coli]